MKKSSLAIFISYLLIFCTHLQSAPLKIGIPQYMPPFIMTGANNKLYGFDVMMMKSICQSIERECVFNTFSFNELINAVASKEIDVAVGAITITVDRGKRVYFSKPYAETYSQFLTNLEHANLPNNLTTFQDKKIGIEQGSIFNLQLKMLGISNATIVPYEREEIMVEALSTNQIDFILMEQESTHYWANTSSGILKPFGQVYKIDSGLGIAINKNDEVLQQQIDNALTNYLQSTDYKKNYQLYLERF